MHHRKTLAMSAAGVLALVPMMAVSAQSADEHDIPHSTSYLPIAPGNVWVYLCEDGIGCPQIQEVRVTASYTVGASTVYCLSNYFFGVSSGPIFVFDQNGDTHECLGPNVGTLYPWSDPNQKVIIPDLMDDCVHGSTGHFVQMDPGSVPVGGYNAAKTIRYDSTPCSDGGLATETFVSGLGLVQRCEHNRAGIRVWDLAYARVNGIEWGQHPLGWDDARRPLPVTEATWGEIKASYR